MQVTIYVSKQIPLYQNTVNSSVCVPHKITTSTPSSNQQVASVGSPYPYP